MKLFASELGHNYGTYSFGYCLYAIREPADTLSSVYAAGYLPYTGSPEAEATAYMARSARITLAEWQPNSENRRVYRKFESVERVIVPVGDRLEDASMFDFCLSYFADRHGNGIMPADRLRHVLRSGWVTDIAEYRIDGEIAAYVWMGRDASATHFFFSFYDLDHVQQSLGLWLMIDMAKNSQERGDRHMYLGTAYGTKGLYKTNFDALEFWDGREWIEDRELLRSHCRLDEGRVLGVADRWKEERSLF